MADKINAKSLCMNSIVVLDSTHYPFPPKRFEMVVPNTISGSQLKNIFVEEFGYRHDAFDLTRARHTPVENETQVIEEGLSTVLYMYKVPWTVS